MACLSDGEDGEAVEIGVRWVPPQVVCLKFNVDGASRGKPRIARIEEVLHDEHGSVKVSFFDTAVIRDSNKVEVLAGR